MSANEESEAKVWQVEALKSRADTQDKLLDRIETRVSEVAKDQVTNQQLEERLRSISNSYEDKLGAKSLKHDADIREINLKYGPLADNYKWVTRLIVGLVIAQLIALGFNLLGGR